MMPVIDSSITSHPQGSQTGYGAGLGREIIVRYSTTPPSP